LLDKTAHLLDGLRRAVAVVERYEVILRPATPPFMIMFQNAVSSLPITPIPEAGRYTRWCGHPDLGSP